MTWQSNTKLLLNYNLAFLLWILYASYWCFSMSPIVLPHLPTDKIFGICWGCGLTHDLVRVLLGKEPDGWLIYLVLFGFFVNFAQSLLMTR